MDSKDLGSKSDILRRGVGILGFLLLCPQSSSPTEKQQPGHPYFWHLPQIQITTPQVDDLLLLLTAAKAEWVRA